MFYAEPLSSNYLVILYCFTFMFLQDCFVARKEIGATCVHVFFYNCCIFYAYIYYYLTTGSSQSHVFSLFLLKYLSIFLFYFNFVSKEPLC